MDYYLPPPVSLDDAPLPPLPDKPYSNATSGTNSCSPRKSTTRQDGPGSKTDDSSAESAPETTGSTGIKRPLNSFFLYKVWAQPYYVKAYPGLSNQVISKMISRDWHNRSDEVKDHFAKLALWEKAKHAQQYPNYKYQPKSNRLVKRKFDKRNEAGVKPESAKPPIQSMCPTMPMSLDLHTYSMNRPSQFGFQLPNQYDLHGNLNDRPLYRARPIMHSHPPEGSDLIQYLRQGDMESQLRADTAISYEAQYYQSGMLPFYPADWSHRLRASHDVYYGNCYPSASRMDSFEHHHHDSMPSNPPFEAAAGSDSNVLTTNQNVVEFQRETVFPRHFRSSEYSNSSGSSGSEPLDSSEASDSCIGDEEEGNDTDTTIYDNEIESLEQRILELRRLKLRKTQKNVRRQIGGRRRTSNSSDSSTMSERGFGYWDDAYKQGMITEIGNMFYSPGSETSNNTFESIPPTSPPSEGSQAPYTRDRYPTHPSVGGTPMNPESSFNFYESASKTLSEYLSNALPADDTIGYLRQFIGDEPVDDAIFQQRDASLSADSVVPMSGIGNLSGAIAFLQNAKREAISDSEDDDKRS